MFHYDVDDKKNLGLDIDESWRGEGDPRFLENPGMADPRPPFVPGPLLAGGHIVVNALGFGRLTSDDEASFAAKEKGGAVLCVTRGDPAQRIR